jgi:hypothetical protein
LTEAPEITLSAWLVVSRAPRVPRSRARQAEALRDQLIGSHIQEPFAATRELEQTRWS